VPRRIHPYLDWDEPIPFAHRGGASDAPENTMEAFQYAVDLGYRYVETDVHVTSDGVLVAFHDDDLSRVCGIEGRISALRWSVVSTALVDGVASIPQFEDLLGAWPELRVNIDCKSDRAEAALESALRRTNSLHRVCIGSFSERRLRRLRSRFGDQVCTSLGSAAVGALRAGVFTGHGNCVQVPVRHKGLPVVDPLFLRTARRYGLPVHVWTIDDPTEMHRLLDMGVGGLMTDRPPVLREVLESRGCWR
jgi:glycerophosphoryl diester phosphodiesterase